MKITNDNCFVYTNYSLKINANKNMIYNIQKKSIQPIYLCCYKQIKK